MSVERRHRVLRVTVSVGSKVDPLRFIVDLRVPPHIFDKISESHALWRVGDEVRSAKIPGQVELYGFNKGLYSGGEG